MATNEVNELEIMYWAPNDESEEKVFDNMKRTYEEIHTYRDRELYGESYQDVRDVLSIQDQNQHQSETFRE